MIDVTVLAGTPGASADRATLLRRQNFAVASDPGGSVTVIDGTGLEATALDDLVTSTAAEDTRLLVLFTLGRGTTFRDRRDRLRALGAADVMSGDAPEDEFVTRVRALLHLSRKPRVLVVEDEDKIGTWAAEVLTGAGMEVARATSLAEAQSVFEAEPVDALVVDRMLPDGDGLDFVKRMKALGFRTPSILFTALSGIDDRIAGLEGANDYICKPVHEAELVARVRVQLRPVDAGDTLIFGPLEIGRRDRVVKWRGHKIEMRRRECDMLVYLADRAGLPIPQRMIYLDVWGKMFMDQGSNPITAARHRMVRDIRSFLTDHGEAYPDFIGTEGDSYVFLAEPLLRLPGPAE